MRKVGFSNPWRWVALALAAGALLLLGHYDWWVRAQLTSLFTASHSAGTAGMPRPTAGGATLTTRNLPAMLSYGLLYIGLSILVLHLALADRRKTRLVLLIYGGALGLIGGLLVAGRVLGVAATLTPVARDMIGGGPIDNGGLLSPLPVLLLLAGFKLAPAATSATQPDTSQRPE